VPTPPPPELIPLSQVPARATGLKRPVTRQTVWNWATRGVQRQVGSESAGRLFLHCIHERGLMFVTPSSLKIFLDAYHRIQGKGNRV
jgi:hypothetical protein